jgi:tetrahydromethanopterin S-methyltransferase subunit B
MRCSFPNDPGLPGALGGLTSALFGFCLALVAYNLLAVVLAALRGIHGEELVDEEVSLYYPYSVT